MNDPRGRLCLAGLAFGVTLVAGCTPTGGHAIPSPSTSSLTASSPSTSSLTASSSSTSSPTTPSRAAFSPTASPAAAPIGTYTGEPTSVLLLTLISDGNAITHLSLSGSWICSTLGLESFTYVVPVSIPLSSDGSFASSGSDKTAAPVQWNVSGRLVGKSGSGLISLYLGSNCSISPDTPWVVQSR